jgi:pimeloyl-ACP methyl ester carboxylesterase
VAGVAVVSGQWETRQVAVDGVRFALRRADPPRRRKTPPALLLHGVPQTGRMWERLARELAGDRVVLAPDLKGLGESEAAGPYDVASLVAELAALALHEVDGPVDVVGHDWGGVLAIALAGARPQLVRRLVVINAPYRHVDLRHAFHMPLFALPWLGEAAFGVGGRRLVENMIRYAWRAPGGPDPRALRADAEAYADPVRIRAMLGYYRENLRPRLFRMLTGAGPDRPDDVPRGQRRLVVWGALDPVLPMAVGEAAVRDLGPDTELLSVPGAGHFVVEEAPDVVVPAVAAFLREPG